MDIQWSFDEEEEIDPIDPIGEISITDGETTILGKSVYLDSWLDGLITGLKGVQEGRRVSIDLVEEPDPLIFEPQNGGVRISYKNTIVSVASINDFDRALRNAVEDFLQKFDRSKSFDKNELLASMLRL